MPAASRLLLALIVASCSGCADISAITPRMTLEERLIFHPRPFKIADERPRDAEFEDVMIDSQKARLHGWYQGVERPTAVVLYCHGNAGNIFSRGWVVRLFRDHLNCSVLVFDYRGYGKSTGVPSEAGVLADARAARRWLAQRAKIAEKDVVLVGTSLGGAVAVDLAAKDGTRALILGSTFTSLPDVASSFFFGMPTRWLINARLDSLSKIAAYHGPLFQTHGDADAIVPFALGQKLFAAANEPKQFIPLPGAGHNDPPTPELVQQLRRFLEALPIPEKRSADVCPARP